MGTKLLNKIADLEKMVHRKIVHHDEFCYWLKLMYLFLLHPVLLILICLSIQDDSRVIMSPTELKMQPTIHLQRKAG
jgi:hypothetical protein